MKFNYTKTFFLLTRDNDICYGMPKQPVLKQKGIRSEQYNNINIKNNILLVQFPRFYGWSVLWFSLFVLFFNPISITILYSSSHCIPQLDLPHHRPKPLYVPVTRNNESTFCTRDQYLAPRVAFITWLVTFFLEKKYVSSAAAAQSAKNGTEVIPKLIQVSVTVPFC